jgi:cobalt-zinc-cadmium efflux system outer membrane protein
MNAPKIPINGRFLACLLAGLLNMGVVTVHAQEALTIERALRLAEDFRPLQDELTAASELADARARRQGVWPNPSVQISQERFDADGAATTQRFYSLSQVFDISGQRGLSKEAAQVQAEATRQQSARTRLGYRTMVRERFYSVLLHQQRSEALQAGLQRLERVAAIVAERHRAGVASGYDQHRMARERAALKARLHQTQADRQQAWAGLRFLLVDAEVPQQVAGTLQPEPLMPLERYLQRVAERGDLQRLKAEARAAGLQRRAAARTWIPDPTIGLGYTTVDQPGPNGGGVMALISIPLPVFDQGRADAAIASARQRRAEARYQRRLAEIRAQVRGLWRKTRQLGEANAEFREQALAQSRELTDIAESAYRAGELGILELLDAYRGQLEARLRALEMARATRDSYIKLLHAAGGFDL